jgi:hypothetical protein
MATASNRVFRPTQCHERDANGQPACQKKRLKSANLCAAHERVWQIAARERRAARLAAGVTSKFAPIATRDANATIE